MQWHTGAIISKLFEQFTGKAMADNSVRIESPVQLGATIRTTIATAALMLNGGGIAGAAAPNAVLLRGEHLARLICTACHVVAPDQEFPPLLRQPAPSFADIANREGVTEQSLRHFITKTHWDESTLPMTMPSLGFNAEQTRAVSRYILSLKTPTAAGKGS